MDSTVRVKPWPGLILAEVPPAGADLPKALAEEWITNHLVIAAPQPPSQQEPTKANKRRRN